jgi:hypothetical protein
MSGRGRGDDGRPEARRAEPPGYGIIRRTAGLVPRERRREWLEEWRSELMHARAEAD